LIPSLSSLLYNVLITIRRSVRDHMGARPRVCVKHMSHSYHLPICLSLCAAVLSAAGSGSSSLISNSSIPYSSPKKWLYASQPARLPVVSNSPIIARRSAVFIASARSSDAIHSLSRLSCLARNAVLFVCILSTAEGFSSPTSSASFKSVGDAPGLAGAADFRTREAF
jgi:hypothetical protein